MTTPIHIWIGTEPKTNIPLQVLKYSILKHSPNNAFEFHDLHGIDWRTLKEAPLQSGTGFSLLRWLIPQKSDYVGRAIYLDVDMLCFSDIKELWELALKNTSVACTYQKDKWYDKAPASSCMLIDCEKAKEQWKYHTEESIKELLQLDTNRKKYVKLMHAQHCYPLPIEIDINWNRFNKRPPGTKILHYTNENTQPWHYPANPEKDIWRDYFIGALQAGLISKQDVESEIKKYQPAGHCIGCRYNGMHKYWAKFLVHAIN